MTATGISRPILSAAIEWIGAKCAPPSVLLYPVCSDDLGFCPERFSALLIRE
jgi:hypothetical protein